MTVLSAGPARETRCNVSRDSYLPKIYNLVNEKGGLMQIQLLGRRTIYMYAADNGMLSDPKAALSVTVTFTDKSSLSAEIIK